ncbi:MAG: serine/threonine protein kinase [Deltaproteobacteria bacterium]|nr:serine/threonine protein kinase [Deltaproteobacteria bacterium]
MEDVELQLAAEQRLGTIIADAYRLGRLLGMGGMGAVYEAAAVNGSRVAIKVLHRFASQIPGAKERFHSEALVARRIQSDGVVRIFDDGVTRDGDLYLVMELLDGESIEERLWRAGGLLPMNEVVPIAASALETLHAAHTAGVIHRDIKPENLFLTTSRTLKVLDFGIAKLTGPDRMVKRTRTGIVMGTPAFMAPEQASGAHGEVDARTDLWAIGAVMFTTLSGRPVHPGEDVGEIMAAAAIRPAPSLARVVNAPLPLVRFVDRALAFDKSERFASASEMKDALRETIEEMRASAMGASVPTGRGVAVSAAGSNLTQLEESDVAAGTGDPFAVVDCTPEQQAELVELFAQLELVLLGVQQYGLGHPETEKRFAAVVAQAVAAVARAGTALSWNVTPYSFAVGAEPLWEPRSPWERVPYQLFADGIRIVSLLPGITHEEADGFLRLITRDRARDMAPEDDFVTMLWELDFEHVSHQAIDSFGEGDLRRRARFERDVRGVQQLGTTSPGMVAHSWGQRPAGAAAGGIAAEAHDQRMRTLLEGTPGFDNAAIASAEAMLSGRHKAAKPLDRALDLTDDMVRVLAAKLDADDATVDAKFGKTVGLAWIEARTSNCLGVLASKFRAAIDVMAAARPPAALAMLSMLCTTVAQKQPDFAPLVLSENALAEVVVWVEQSNDPNHVRALRDVLSIIDGRFVPRVLDVLFVAREGPVKDSLFAYLARSDLQNEVRLGQMLTTATEEAGLAIFRVLVRIGTPAAQAAIAQGASSPHAVVRIEAIGHVEGPTSERLRTELKKLLEAEDPGQRMAALLTIQKNAVRVAGPSLVLRIKSPKFEAVSIDEKQTALETLAALAPRRAEDVCIELVKNAGILPSEARDQTRLVAAELLGRVASTPDAVEALEAVASARWRTSEKLRNVARAAQQRLSRPPPGPMPSVPPGSTPSVPPWRKP